MWTLTLGVLITLAWENGMWTLTLGGTQYSGKGKWDVEPYNGHVLVPREGTQDVEFHCVELAIA
jgi:hypothetical protein